MQAYSHSPKIHPGHLAFLPANSIFHRHVSLLLVECSPTIARETTSIVKTTPRRPKLRKFPPRLHRVHHSRASHAFIAHSTGPPLEAVRTTKMAGQRAVNHRQGRERKQTHVSRVPRKSRAEPILIYQSWPLPSRRDVRTAAGCELLSCRLVQRQGRCKVASEDPMTGMCRLLCMSLPAGKL